MFSQGCCFIQSLHFSYVLQEDSVKFSRKFISVPCQPSGRRGIPSGLSSVSNICPHDEIFPSGRPAVQSFSRPNDVSYRSHTHQTKASSVRTTWIPVRTFLCVEKPRTTPACILPDVSAARPDDSQCSTKLQIFFPKSNMGRLLQPSGRATP